MRKGKIPFTPATGKGAKAGVPDTWGTFGEALAALERGGYDGIGFEFHNNGIVGIDIDHAIDPATGEVSALAREIIAKMNSYTEFSPSGTGVHIFAFGDIPAEGRKDPKKGIEFYKAKRYFTMTGNVWEPPKPVQRRGHELRELYGQLFPGEDKPRTLPKPTVQGDRLAEGLERDPVLRELWEGRRNHGDESSDDMALMNKLAYWCSGDTAAMIEAFLRSPYASQKDAKHLKKLERRDYLERTARDAAAKCRGSAAEDNARFRAKRDFSPKAGEPQTAGPASLADFKRYPLSLDILKTALAAFGISVRYNVISNELEIKGLPAEYSGQNAANTLPVYLLDKLKAAGIKCTKAAIEDYLLLIADTCRFNPVRDMLESTAWDGADRFPVLCEILGIEEPLYKTFVKKWAIQCVAMAMNGDLAPVGADGVLVLQGPQGAGKTSFFSVLAIYPEWFTEGAELNTDDKDSILKATRSWICELGELEGTMKREVAGIKAHITAPFDIIRAPYAKNATRRPRRTSYCGTVNVGEYLRDETGNRRFWTVPIDFIDLEKLRGLSVQWRIQVWAQAYDIFRHDRNAFRLTREERHALAVSNARFERKLPFEQEIRDRLDFDLPEDQWEWVKISDLAARTSVKITAEQAGHVLVKLEQEGNGIQRARRKAGVFYLVPMRRYL